MRLLSFALAKASLIVAGPVLCAIAGAAAVGGAAALVFGMPAQGMLMLAGAAGVFIGSIGIRRSLVLLAMSLALTACGAGGDDYAAQLRGEIAVPAAAGLPTLPPPPTPTTEPTTAPTSTTAPPPTAAPALVAPVEPSPTPQPMPTAEPVQSIAPQVVYVTATPAPLPGVIVVIAADTDGGACRPTTAEPCEVQP